MAVHIEYVQRIPNSKGELPKEPRQIELGGTEESSPILIENIENPENPDQLLIRIDACADPEVFSQSIIAMLHGMAGELEGVTLSHRKVVKDEVTDLGEIEAVKGVAA
ncbi:hypothetical protein [Glutamicibacter arilaitensis]|uniref:hypothetical protein n=1 Tax=Glutamicibacter arilaitensis TaxID=256701 RepID=UPI003F924BED